MSVFRKVIFSLIISTFLFIICRGIIGFSERSIVLSVVFLTIFLTIFFIFNIKQYPLMILHNRIKDAQISFIELMYERTGQADWDLWAEEYKSLREGIRRELKNELNKKKNYITESGFDSLIDKSWDGMFSFFGADLAEKQAEAESPVELPGNTVPEETEGGALSGGEKMEVPEPVDSKNMNNAAVHSGGLLAVAMSLVARDKAGPEKPVKNTNVRPLPDDIPDEVIFELDGIHYVNNDLFKHAENSGGKLDGNFVKLVESVVGPLTPPPVT